MKGLKGALAVLAIALASGAAGVLAQDKEAVLKDRTATMKGQGAGMASVKAYLDGTADLAKAQEGAQQVAVNAKKIPDLFPPGTGMAELGLEKSAAKPAVWTDWPKFLETQKTLVSESDKLVDATKGGDKAKIQEQFAATGKNGCGACHGTFREKKS
jgi:cytochrome c556